MHAIGRYVCMYVDELAIKGAELYVADVYVNQAGINQGAIALYISKTNGYHLQQKCGDGDVPGHLTRMNNKKSFMIIAINIFC